MRFNRRLNPFHFLTLATLACSIDPPNGTDGGGGGGSPPAAGAPAGTPPTPPAGGTPPAAGAPAGNSGQFEPGWLPGRLEQAKNSARADLLKELGVPDAAAAAKVLAEGKKALDATKTELQRKDEELEATKLVASEAKTMREALTKRAAVELAKLPEAAQLNAKALAGDDPVKLLAAIDMALAMTPAAAAPAAPPAGGAPAAGQGAPAGQAKPPVPPAANTTGAAGGPPSAPGSPTDHLAVWKDMQAKNPMAAAHYYLDNQNDIVTAQQKSTSQ